MFGNKNKTQIYFGGSSSGKSHGWTQRAVLDCVNGRNVLVARKVKATIRNSSFNEIQDKISTFKLSQYFKINISDMTITCTLNNRQILFVGADDPEKIKSIKPKSGVITDIVFEEATEFDYKDFKLLEKRLRGKSKFVKRMTLVFNPIFKEHWIFNEFFGIWEDDKQYIEKDGVSILKSTYKDNPFLEQDDIERLEDESDPYFHNVYTLGNWGVLGAVIFTNYVKEDFTELESTFDNYFNGVDWGFAKDPFAYIRVHVDNRKKIIYVCNEIYETGLTNDKSAAQVLEYIGHNELVTCDSSEPKSVEDYKQLGIYAKGAEKGKGSIEFGINKLKEYQIKIHPRCINFWNEIIKYKYMEDKNGNVLPKPVDKDNHGIDALRYALESLFKVMLDGFVGIKQAKIKRKPISGDKNEW